MNTIKHLIVFLLISVSAYAQDFVPKRTDRLFELDHKYIDEDIIPNKVAQDFVAQLVVEYLEEDELEPYQLQVKNGKIYQNGKLYSTRLDRHRAHTIWVLDQQGRIFITDKNELNRFHHSSFVKGEPVYGAGEIFIEKGRILVVTNKSGHYSPSSRFTKILIRRLKELGYSNASSIPVKDQRKYTISIHAKERFNLCNQSLR